jgi:ribosome-associated translation inhibitor RaiA
MKIPLEITYRNVQKDDSLETLIFEKSAKLEQVCGHIASCRIAIERPQRHQRSGSSYRVRLDITVPPSNELVVKREAGEGEMHEELSTVIRKVFGSARRKLRKYKEVQRGEIKIHSREKIPVISGEFNNFAGNH